MAGLDGRVVLVTGAGIRLGRAIALELGRAGAAIGVHYNASAEGAREVVAALARDGVRAEAFQADLARSEASEQLVAEVEKTLGPVDALINSAAVFHRKPFLETSAELLDTQWAVNARGPFLLTQAAARMMHARAQGGDVVNILDVGGTLNAWRDYSGYCMTKAAMGMLTRCLALELAPKIRVNAVAPGTVLPPEGLTPEVLERIRNNIPQLRFGAPEDVARTVRFLLEGPAFITGQIIAVDGGRSVSSVRE